MRTFRRFPSVPVSSEHRAVWGWLRLVLGLTQMAFAVTAAGLLISSGVHWPALVALSLTGIATGASRYLYRGQTDPRLAAAGLETEAAIVPKPGVARGEGAATDMVKE
jgi:hypothetical protein